MSSSLGLGQPIPAYTQLYDYASGKFPRAVVRDADGAELSGSPIDLAEIADGLYGNSDLAMPDTAHVTVQYFVYSDSGHTSLDQSYAAELDVFTKEVGGGGGSSGIISNIIGIIDGEGCKQTGIQDTLIKGSERSLAIRLVSEFPNGAPLDLTGNTEILAKFLKEDRTILSLTKTGGAITVVSDAAGSLQIAITAVQSALLMPGSPMPFTMVVTLPTGPVALNFPYQLQILDEAVE